MNKKLLIGITAAVGMVILGIVWARQQPDNNAVELTRVSKMEITPTSKLRKPTLFKTEQGVSFYYDANEGKFHQIGKRIGYSFNGESDKLDQWIEVMTKSPTDSLEQAVSRRFITPGKEKDCRVIEMVPEKGDVLDGFDKPYKFVELTTIKPWFQTENKSIVDAQAEKCGREYTATNFVAFFVMDTREPGIYAFVYAGQSGGATTGMGDKQWFQSLNFGGE